MNLPTRIPYTARALAVLAALWLVLFSPQLFAQRAFMAGDAPLFRRFSEYSRERWRTEHERTFWNPFVFFGLPATASLADQTPQFLPDAALDALERVRSQRWLPPLAGPLLAQLAGVLAMALLARGLWGAGFEAMVWAGMGWALLPGLLVPFTFGHDAQFASAALIPLPLLLAHVLFASESRWNMAWAALGLAATIGLQGLTGHPQMIAAGGALLAVFALERAIHFGRPLRLIAVALAVATAAAMSAAEWWPELQYGAISVRGGGHGADALDVAAFSQSWRDLASMVWPRAVGFGGGTYWGGLRKTDFPQFAGTLICAFALFAWPRRGRRELGAVLALGATAIAGVLLSLGSNLPMLDRLLREHVPFFAQFRVSVVWLILAQFSLVLLSALGIERVQMAPVRRDPVTKALALAAVAAVLATLTGLALAWSPLRDTMVGLARDFRPALSADVAQAAASNGGYDLALRGALLAAASLLWLAARKGRRLAGALGIALALHALDLGSVSVPFLIESAGPASRLAAPAPPPLAQVAAADPHARAMPLDPALAASNDWVAWKARCVVGVHGAVYEDWADLMNAGLQYHYEALCALAVRYITIEPGATNPNGLWSEVEAGGRPLPVARLTHACERAYCVPHVSAPGDRAACLRRMFSPAFHAADQAVAEDRAVAGEYPGSAGCRLRWIEDSPDRLRLACDAPDRAFLVVADPMLPGWQAMMDGVPATMTRVDYLIRGLALPSGTHEITMSYTPPGWKESVPASRSALGLVLIGSMGLGAAQLGVRRRRATDAVRAVA